ncbi:hypothetical protein V3H18_12975 [Methylocystis sp. 9N]|uniref:Cytochrome c n=1 Tax=Methylocystis borbori TaxID=3118750 RepID=A0ABU7XJ94_9HYPH
MTHRKIAFAAVLSLSLFAVIALVPARGADHDDDHNMHMHGHGAHMDMSSKMTDSRKEVDLPSPMRAHMLANMRGHAEAVAEILAALGKGDGAGAAKVAETQLGLGSPHAAACKPAAKSGELGPMPAMMAQHMPDDMRALGLAMHEQASKFAKEAEKIGPGGDMRPALAELSHVVQGCNACHAAYRLD